MGMGCWAVMANEQIESDLMKALANQPNGMKADHPTRPFMSIAFVTEKYDEGYLYFMVGIEDYK